LDKEIVAEDTTVETIVGDYPASPELFRWVAGAEPIGPVGLIGMGALGSAVFNHLVRSGLDDAIVYDDDIARPHNLARHTGRTSDLYKPKVDHASELLHELAGRCRCSSPPMGEMWSRYPSTIWLSPSKGVS
jgi:hypothetical protein